MGYNTSVILINDALDQIAKDTEFGKKLADAVLASQLHGYVDVPAGCHANAASVIETHHADETAIIALGQNYGKKLASAFYAGPFHEAGSVGQVRILKALADALGYKVIKKGGK